MASYIDKMAVNDATLTVPVEDETKKGPDAVLESDSSSISGSRVRARYKQFDECAFDTTEDPRYYKPIPEYEGIHRWDPDFDWSPEEEKRLIRKVFLLQPRASHSRR
jgi:hypothetical protein